jgi:hypothetical protein
VVWEDALCQDTFLEGSPGRGKHWSGERLEKNAEGIRSKIFLKNQSSEYLNTCLLLGDFSSRMSFASGAKF